MSARMSVSGCVVFQTWIVQKTSVHKVWCQINNLLHHHVCCFEKSEKHSWNQVNWLRLNPLFDGKRAKKWVVIAMACQCHKKFPKRLFVFIVTLNHTWRKWKQKTQHKPDLNAAKQRDHHSWWFHESMQLDSWLCQWWQIVKKHEGNCAGDQMGCGLHIRQWELAFWFFKLLLQTDWLACSSLEHKVTLT